MTQAAGGSEQTVASDGMLDSIRQRSAAFTTAYLWLSAVTLVLVVVQAVVIGQVYVGSGGAELHGYVGNATFAVSVLAALCALLAGFDAWIKVLAGLTVLLLFTQTGLGYAGRSNLDLRAIHVPLGVTTFGVATAAFVGGLAVVLARSGRLGGSGDSGD